MGRRGRVLVASTGVVAMLGFGAVAWADDGPSSPHTPDGTSHGTGSGAAASNLTSAMFGV
jgi:hypothetical protein